MNVRSLQLTCSLKVDQRVLPADSLASSMLTDIISSDPSGKEHTVKKKRRFGCNVGKMCIRGQTTNNNPSSLLSDVTLIYLSTWLELHTGYVLFSAYLHVFHSPWWADPCSKMLPVFHRQSLKSEVNLNQTTLDAAHKS